MLCYGLPWTINYTESTMAQNKTESTKDSKNSLAGAEHMKPSLVNQGPTKHVNQGSCCTEGLPRTHTSYKTTATKDL